MNHSISRPSTPEITTARSRTRCNRKTSPKSCIRTTKQLGGKVLRLKQQYFFASCSLQDMLRLHRLRRRPMTEFHRYWTVQLNDTHPSVAIAELMRLLLDEHEVGWQEAWEITRHAFAYTNHTLLPEALEKWPLGVFGQLLPRHLQVIYEINARFLAHVRERHPMIRRASPGSRSSTRPGRVMSGWRIWPRSAAAR